MKRDTNREIVKEAAEDAAVAAVQATGPQTRAIARIVLITIFIVLGIVAAIFTLRALTGVILMVVLAIFFAYLIAPLVEFVRRPFNMLGHKRAMPRGLAIGIVYVVIFGSLVLLVSLLYPSVKSQVEEFVKQVPQYVANAKQSNIAQRLNGRYLQLPHSTREVIQAKLSETQGEAGQALLGLAGLVLYLPWFVLVPILGFFLLKDADSFRRSALQMLPSGRWRWRGDEFFQDVNSTLAAYIRAQLIACLLIGIICTIGFSLLGLRYALLLGIVAGFLEFIPLVGPLVVAVIATLIASFYSFKLAVGVLIFLGVLRIIHDYVTYPRIIGQGIHLHPLAVILAILCGAELAGITGIFLAIPVVAVATVTYRHWLEHRGSAGLMSELLTPDATAPILAVETFSRDDTLTLPRVEDVEPDAQVHPRVDTTPEEMARLRPDLTSGQLKMPDLD
jgi:predicted PurR-regulated permease PerM